MEEDIKGDNIFIPAIDEDDKRSFTLHEGSKVITVLGHETMYGRDQGYRLCTVTLDGGRYSPNKGSFKMTDEVANGLINGLLYNKFGNAEDIAETIIERRPDVAALIYKGLSGVTMDEYLEQIPEVAEDVDIEEEEDTGMVASELGGELFGDY